MSRWHKYNANPVNARVGDCVIRAICTLLEKSWGETYLDLCLEGYEKLDLPSANHVWGSYLRKKGFKRAVIDDSCSDCYTVEDFCKMHENGRFLLALNSHVVCVIDGYFYDTWDSKDEVVSYFWSKG